MTDTPSSSQARGLLAEVGQRLSDADCLAHLPNGHVIEGDEHALVIRSTDAQKWFGERYMSLIRQLYALATPSAAHQLSGEARFDSLPSAIRDMHEHGTGDGSVVVLTHPNGDWSVFNHERSAEFLNAATPPAQASAVQAPDDAMVDGESFVPVEFPIERALKDPNIVHINMLRGAIARPSPRQIVHIYGEEAIRRALPSLSLATIHNEAVEACAKVAEDEGLIGSESRRPGSHGRTRADHGKLIADRIRTFLRLDASAGEGR